MFTTRNTLFDSCCRCAGLYIGQQREYVDELQGEGSVEIWVRKYERVRYRYGGRALSEGREYYSTDRNSFCVETVEFLYQQQYG